eukprot:TRINITY_DN6975_c0_g1_i2.p1 TRINITY_DN6975_c0_g1~~TRINITY_DN6975_c0_g1_i2.p1  ORF type:complete len:118 (+),score=8.32 TRINITY_DN6975_c0_g1_i2:1021-1374(+)
MKVKEGEICCIWIFSPYKLTPVCDFVVATMSGSRLCFRLSCEWRRIQTLQNDESGPPIKFLIFFNHLSMILWNSMILSYLLHHDTSIPQYHGNSMIPWNEGIKKGGKKKPFFLCQTI